MDSSSSPLGVFAMLRGQVREPVQSNEVLHGSVADGCMRVVRKVISDEDTLLNLNVETNQ